MADPTMDQIDQLERSLRFGNRDNGTMGAAIDDTVQVLRDMLSRLTEVRASVMAYCGRAIRAESAHQELAVMQDLYERCKQDRDSALASAEIFRRSWLDTRDLLEVRTADLEALKKKEARRG